MMVMWIIWKNVSGSDLNDRDSIPVDTDGDGIKRL